MALFYLQPHTSDIVQIDSEIDSHDVWAQTWYKLIHGADTAIPGGEDSTHASAVRDVVESVLPWVRCGATRESDDRRATSTTTDVSKDSPSAVEVVVAGAGVARAESSSSDASKLPHSLLYTGTARLQWSLIKDSKGTSLLSPTDALKLRLLMSAAHHEILNFGLSSDAGFTAVRMDVDKDPVRAASTDQLVMTVDKLNEKMCMTFVGDVSFTELPTSIHIGEFMDMRLYVSPGSYFLPKNSVDPDLFWPAWAVPTRSHAGDATLLVMYVSKAVQ